MTTHINIEPICPRVANFIKTKCGKNLSVSELPDAALRRLGKEYGENLIKRKAEQLATKKELK